MHELHEQLIKLGLIEPESTKSIKYLWDTSNDWDLLRAVASSPFYRHLKKIKNKNVKFKTLIFNQSFVYNFLATGIHTNAEVYNFLLQLGFDIYIRVAEGEYLKIRDMQELRLGLPNILLVNDKKIIESELLALQQNLNDIVIIDDDLDIALQKVINTSKSNTDFNFSNPSRSHKYVGDAIDNNIDVFSRGKYKKIISTNQELESIVIKWKNDFKPHELKELLNAFSNINKYKILEFLNTPHLETVKIDLFPELDLEIIKSVKDLELAQVQAIKNIDALQDLRLLQLNSCEIPEIDLTKLPKLEEIALIGDNPTRILYSKSSQPMSLNKISFAKNGFWDTYLILNPKGEVLFLKIVEDPPPIIKFADKIPELEAWVRNSIRPNINTLRSFSFRMIEKIEFISSHLKEVDISEFKNLKVLKVGLKGSLESLIGIPTCPLLEELSISCRENKEIHKILKEASFVKCIALNDGDSKWIDLSANDALETLVINEFKDLEILDLSHLKNLKTLHISHCSNLRSIRLPESVTDLKISFCPQLKNEIDIDNFEKLFVQNSNQIKFYNTERKCQIQELTIKLSEEEFRKFNISKLRKLKLLLLNDWAEKFGNLLEESSDGSLRPPGYPRMNSQDLHLITNFFPLQKTNDSAESRNQNFAKSSQEDLREKYLLNEEKMPEKHKLLTEDNSFMRIFQVEESYATAFDFDSATIKEDEEPLLDQKIFLDENIKSNYYRDQVIDSLYIDKNSNIIKEQSYKKLIPTKLVPPTTDAAIAQKEIRLKKGQEIVLTGLTANDKLCELSDIDYFDIFINENHQYVIKLKETAPNSYVNVIRYGIIPDSNYLIEYENPVHLDIKASEIDKLAALPNGRHYLSQIVAHLPQPPFSSVMTPSQALTAIVTHCRDFQESTQNVVGTDVWNKLFDMAFNKKGSCDHRSMVAKLLCDFYQIPCSIINSKIHTFIEVQTRDGRRVGIDLGGSPVILEPIPAAKMLPAPSKDKMEIDIPSTNPYEEKFLGEIKWVIDAHSFPSFVDQIQQKNKTQLIRTESQDEENKCYESFAQYAKETNTKFVYVNDVSDLSQLLKPIKISEGFKTLEGPLAKLFNEGGIVLINWSNFTANERGIYKTLLEDPPTFGNKTLPKNVKIVGMLDNRIRANDVFLSRTHSIPAPKHLFAPKTKVSSVTGLTSQPKSINLYYTQNWMPTLIQDPIFHNGQATLQKGELVTAMEKGLPFEIINPPQDDPSFESMYKRVKFEGKIFFDGEMIEAKPGFSLTLKEKEISLMPPVGFNFSPIPDHVSGKKYYVNRRNYTSLFKGVQINNQDQLNSKNGILADLNPSDCLIFTEELEPAELAYFYEQISKWDKTKLSQITFCIQPQKPEEAKDIGEITGLKEFDGIKHKHIQSSDPHFVARHLSKNLNIPNKNIFYLTGENTWTHLVEKKDFKIEENKFTVTRRLSRMWKNLEKGKTVLIVGNLSDEDQGALESLFADPPYLYVNGERQEAKGRLIWASKPQLDSTPLTQATLNYTPSVKDYQQALETELITGELKPPPKLVKKRILKTDKTSTDTPMEEVILEKPKRKHEESETSDEPSTKRLKQEVKIEIPEVIMSDTFFEPLKQVKQANINLGVIKKINDLYSYINKLTTTKKPPYAGHFTYEKYRQFYSEILFKKSEHKNPLKSVLSYHFEKNSEEYAYVNAISKMLFYKLESKPHIRYEALQKLITRDENGQIKDEDFHKNIWRIINCFDGETIFLRFNISLENLMEGAPPMVSPNIYDKVKETVNDLLHIEIAKRDRTLKQEREVLQAVLDKNQPLVFLLGEAGTGKTFSIRKVAKKNHLDLFEGIHHIDEWLNCKNAESLNHILLLDEGNMLRDQRLEFLRGLAQNPPVCNYNGKKYPLTEKHKVFITGNPLSYVGREFHEVLWDCAHLIWFSPFQEDFIRAFVKNSMENVSSEIDKNMVSDIVAKFYLHMAQNKDRTTDLTLRDIESITAKLILYKGLGKFKTWEQCAREAIYTEVHGILNTDQARQNLRDHLGVKPLNYQCIIDDEMVIPERQMQIWHMITEDLKLRDIAVEKKEALPFKRGILLEGPSGVGKSKMMLNVLRRNGFSLDAEDPQKRYYNIKVGEKGAHHDILKAFKEGSIVILDELNLDPSLEALLNQLLDANNHDYINPGFMVLSTQNPDHYQGCAPSSKALTNRLHKIVMNEYTADELEFIAKARNYPEPAQFTQGFFSAQKKYPLLVNTRNFLEALQEWFETSKKTNKKATH